MEPLPGPGFSFATSVPKKIFVNEFNHEVFEYLDRCLKKLEPTVINVLYFHNKLKIFKAIVPHLNRPPDSSFIGSFHCSCKNSYLFSFHFTAPSCLATISMQRLV